MPPAHDPQARGLDPVAVGAALRRLARAPSAPWLHTEVARRMAQRLEPIRFEPPRVLEWWGGLGAGAPWLARAYPGARHECIEPDAAWAARSRAAHARPWWAPPWGPQARRAAAPVVTEDAAIAPGAGLIWANMMLHAVVDPSALFERWHGLLQIDGFVMFSCLGPGTLRELRAVYADRDWGPPTPTFVDMHDLGDMLVQAGFADPVMDQETLTLTWNSAAKALAELRTLGSNAAPQRGRGLRTPRWRDRLERALQALAAPDGTIGLSFEVAYGHAFKAGPRVRPGVATTVSLQDMRSMVGSRPGAPKKPQALR